MANELPEIAIGGTFYNGEPFIHVYFKSLLDLDYPKDKIRLCFVYGESSDRTEPFLREFQRIHNLEYRSIRVRKLPRVEHKEKQTALQINVCNALNELIRWSEPDNLVVMEQDIKVSSNTIHRLLRIKGMGAAICSGVTLVTGGTASYELKDGSCLRITGLPHVSAYWTMGEERIPISKPTSAFQLIVLPYKGKILEVHALGTALVYLTREVMDKLKFEPDINEFGLTNQTQDINYCDRARKFGLQIMVDTGLWYDHLHYSYRTWADKNGMRILLTDSTKTDFVSGFVIPKAEIDRQGKTVQTVKLIIPEEIEGSIVERD